MLPLTRRAERAPRREVFPLARLRDEMAAMFDRFAEGWMVPEEDFFRTLPSWEWEDGEKEVVLRAPVVGFAPEEVEVKLLANELSIRAEHREEAKGKDNGRESRYGRIERLVTLPAGVDASRIEAKLSNGMLEVHLPRLPEAEARRIKVT